MDFKQQADGLIDHILRSDNMRTDGAEILALALELKYQQGRTDAAKEANQELLEFVKSRFPE